MGQKHKYADVIKAWADGKAVQFSYGEGWRDYLYGFEKGSIPSFNSPKLEWRIKPEPRTGWVNVYPDSFTSHSYASRKEADSGQMSDKSRIACVQWTEGEGI